MTQFGVLVSEYNGDIDWKRASAGNVSFAMVRGYGPFGVDPLFSSNLAAVKEAGIIPGVVATIYNGRSHGEDAEAFIAALGSASGTLVALDVDYLDDKETNADEWMGVWRFYHPEHPVLQYGGHDTVALTSRSSNGPLLMAGQTQERLHPPKPGMTLAQTYDLLSGDGAGEWSKNFQGWAGPTVWEFFQHCYVPGFETPVRGLAYHGNVWSLKALTNGS